MRCGMVRGGPARPGLEGWAERRGATGLALCAANVRGEDATLGLFPPITDH